MDIFKALANDANVSPAMRRLYANPPQNFLSAALAKAEPRRFTGERVTAFSALEDELFELDRRDETGDRAAHERDDSDERAERGL